MSEWVGFRLPRDIIYDRIVCVRAFERERGLPLSVTWVGCAGADQDDEGDDVVGHLSLALISPFPHSFASDCRSLRPHWRQDEKSKRCPRAVCSMNYAICTTLLPPPALPPLPTPPSQTRREKEFK